MFNWLGFLDSQRIEYQTSGANVARGNIVVHCPFCGSADQSFHMSISIEGRGYRCWRKPEHRGKNPARLVAALLGCSYQHAAEITGTNAQLLPDDFLSRVRELIEPKPQEQQRVLKLPTEFRPFGKQKPMRHTNPYYGYLLERGFTEQDLHQFTSRYNVYYALRGAWKGRIVFALYYQKQLVSWTGRTIYRQVEPRYKALTTDPERAARMDVPHAISPLTDYLLWFDKLRKSKAHTLVLTEGPFDALNVNVLGRRHGIRSTCFFTSEPSLSQIDLLHELLPRYKRKLLLLDAGTLSTAVRVQGMLTGLGVEVKQLPHGVKDPGELDEMQLLNIVT